MKALGGKKKRPQHGLVFMDSLLKNYGWLEDAQYQYNAMSMENMGIKLKAQNTFPIR